MTNSTLKRSARRILDRHGRDVVHREYAKTGEDGYGDPTYNDATTTRTARVARPNSPMQVRDESGEEVDVDVRFSLKDSVSVTGVAEGSGRADEFDVDGTTYKALRVDDQDNGLTVVDAIRK